jgi:glycosyltransferase involved in cell wall biosynthesis
MPFFSIIIPTYNRSSKLKNALDSVLSQTFSNFEILIMDDGSVDDTPKIIAEYKDNRIIYQWDLNSGGPSHPRNRGLSISKGEWICFLDSDDWWKKDKLEVCSKMLNDKVDLLYHDLEIIDKTGGKVKNKISKGRILNKNIIQDLLINGNAINNSSVIIRKTVFDQIGLINESKEMIASEDLNTWLRIAEITNRFLYLPKTLGYYYVDNTGISLKNMKSSIGAATLDFIKYLNKKEIKKYNATLRYINASYYYSMFDYKWAINDFYYSLLNGSLLIKLKSIFKLSRILYKKYFN